MKAYGSGENMDGNSKQTSQLHNHPECRRLYLEPE